MLSMSMVLIISLVIYTAVQLMSYVVKLYMWTAMLFAKLLTLKLTKSTIWD
jgi:hypothetical protein